MPGMDLQSGQNLLPSWRPPVAAFAGSRRRQFQRLSPRCPVGTHIQRAACAAVVERAWLALFCSVGVVFVKFVMDQRKRRKSGRSRGLKTDQVSQGTVSSSASLHGVLLAIWGFTRPQTLIGTLISIPAILLFATAPFLANQPALLGQLLLTTCRALVPALLVNIYITGLNQIFDIDIDKVNKPYLPLASGRLSIPSAWCIVVLALSCAQAMAWSYPSQLAGWALHLSLIGSAVLGTAYSAPPMRLKRFPFLAALSIIVVRGVIINAGFYYYAATALGLAGQVSNLRSGLATGFFAVFGLVIALMKDVPDVLGDEQASIRSLSVRLGPARVFTIAADVLKGLLLVTSCAFAIGCACALSQVRVQSQIGLTTLTRSALAVAALLGYKLVQKRQQGVDPHDPIQVYSFYMFVWKLFYVSYLLLPLA